MNDQQNRWGPPAHDLTRAKWPARRMAVVLTLVAAVALGGTAFALVPRLVASPHAGGAQELPATWSPSIVDASGTPAGAGMAGSSEASPATGPPSTAASRPPAGPAPASHWLMNEKTGTTAHDSVAGHHAKFVGGVYWAADRGGAVSFNGTGTLTTSGPVIDTSKSFTISAWAKISINQRWSVIAAQYGNRASGFLLGYSHVTQSWTFGMPQADVDDPDNSDIDTASGAAIVQHGVYYHVVGVYD